MYINAVELKGFQCFGKRPAKIDLSKGITTLIGTNGSGKTALLTGLLRLFGVTRNQRTIRRSDFYLPPSKDEEVVKSQDLWIDVRLQYPELSRECTMAESIPACFNHMVVEKSGGLPFCRLRLEAEWTDDGTIDGDITQKLFWVITNERNPGDEHKVPVRPHERGLIQVHYLPASRDESSLLKYATGLMAGRLLKAIEWSSDTLEIFEEATEKIQNSFSDETGIKSINSVLKKKWMDLYSSPVFKNPELQMISKNFDEVVRNVSILFNPGSDGGEGNLDDLSDGQKSLFYFSLAATAFNIERELVNSCLKPPSAHPTTAKTTGFIRENLDVPCLTVFALEEPENHLAP